MAKFKMRFKLTGLEVEIEGDRQDAGQLSNAISRQLGGMMAPIANVAALGSGESDVIDVDPSPALPAAPPAKAGGRKKSGSKGSKGAKADPIEPLDWRHDVTRWGSPKQGWTTATKSLWALYVISEQTEFKELTAAVIAASFNKHFRQAGNVRPSNVSRDLGLLKTNKTPAWVNEDTTSEPSKWYLTDEGVRQAQALVSEAKGEGTT